MAVVSSLLLHFVNQHCSTIVLPGNSTDLGSMQSIYAHTHTSPTLLHVACAANTTLLHNCSVVHSTADSCGVYLCSSFVRPSLQLNSLQWDDLDLRLLLSGLPPHPGPGGAHDFTFLFWNINSLSKYLPIIVKYEFDVCFAQEVSAPWHMLSAIYTRLKNLNIKALLTGTDPETMKTGGVGALSSGRVPITKLKPITPRMKSLVNGGRVQLVGLSLPGNILLVVYNLYLWTNGHTDPAAAFRSDDMLNAVNQEFAQMAPGPRLLCGDFNCDPEDLPTLGSMLTSGAFVDLGASALFFGQVNSKPTCYPHGGSPSRRDYVIASADLLPLITRFEVHDRDLIPVHAPITLTLSIPDACPKKTVLSQPNAGSSSTLFACVRELHGIDAQGEIPDNILRATKDMLHAQISAAFDAY